MTAEQLRITTNKLRGILSRLARSTANLMSKNGCFGAVFRTMVVKDQDHLRCVNGAFSMRAVRVPLRMGFQRDANRDSVRRAPCRAATRWSILR